MSIAPEAGTLPSPEGTPSREGLATREQVIEAFNGAVFRWATKIYRLRREINPPLNIEIDDLADTNLTPEQRDELGSYRNFEKGALGLAGGGLTTLSEWLKKDTITTHFKDPYTGEVYQREEGLDVSDLIDSARDDIGVAETRLRDEKTSRYPYEPSIKWAEEELAKCQTEARILEENSIPRGDLFPHDLDGNNPVGRARVAEEARRVWKNPLTSTGSIEGDRQVAIARLRKARLLVIPKRVETPKEPTKITKEEPKIEGKQPVAVVAEPEKVEPVRRFEEEIGGVSTPPFTPEPDRGFREPDLSGRSEISTDWRITYPESLRRFIGSLRESGTTSASEVADKLRGFGKDLGEKIPNTEVRKRVKDLTGRIKIPETDRRRRVAMLALAVGVLLLSLTPRDSFPQSAFGNEGTPDRFPSGQLDNNVPTMGPVAPRVTETGNAVPSPAASAPPRTNIWELNREVLGTNPPAEPIQQPPPSQPQPQKPPEHLPWYRSMLGVEIQSGQTVRGIIEAKLKEAAPDADEHTIDRAASVYLWVVGADNQQIADLDKVKPGDRIQIRDDLSQFMEGFDPKDPKVDDLDHVPNTKEAIDKAQMAALVAYEYAVSRSLGGKGR